MSATKDRLIWIDLEMTGLDVERERIIEIATVVTDDNLEIIAEGPMLAVHQSDELLASMDEWNASHHGSSGLCDRVRQSSVSESDAEKQTIAFLQEHLSAGASPMCGNSVHQDRKFLAKYMPELADFFHYRNLDVSTLKELAARWRPDLKLEKESKHLALDDVKDSIDELKLYREHFLKMTAG
jgi:oligoribonuclease